MVSFPSFSSTQFKEHPAHNPAASRAWNKALAASELCSLLLWGPEPQTTTAAEPERGVGQQLPIQEMVLSLLHKVGAWTSARIQSSA